MRLEIESNAPSRLLRFIEGSLLSFWKARPHSLNLSWVDRPAQAHIELLGIAYLYLSSSFPLIMSNAASRLYGSLLALAQQKLPEDQTDNPHRL